jgi:hypothetical protein
MVKNNYLKWILLFVIVLLFFLGLDAVLKIRNTQTIPRDKDITNFDECIAAGNPAMESYPLQCRDSVSGKTFVEKISDSWRLDGIQLMLNDADGTYGCFGCSEPGNEPAICIDPIPEMKQVIETKERYCSSDFEVIEEIKCLDEQRDVDACIEIYQPVCGIVNVQCVTTPCDPIKETFSNSCKACSNSLVSSYVKGEC